MQNTFVSTPSPQQLAQCSSWTVTASALGCECRSIIFSLIVQSGGISCRGSGELSLINEHKRSFWKSLTGNLFLQSCPLAGAAPLNPPTAKCPQWVSGSSLNVRRSSWRVTCLNQPPAFNVCCTCTRPTLSVIGACEQPWK